MRVSPAKLLEIYIGFTSQACAYGHHILGMLLRPVAESRNKFRAVSDYLALPSYLDVAIGPHELLTRVEVLQR